MTFWKLNLSRDIESYHQNIVFPAYAKQKERSNKEKEEFVELPERMPYIAIVIDELADIMSTYPRELEAGVVRLAQMSESCRYSPGSFHPTSEC